jgi:O-antigen ligase
MFYGLVCALLAFYWLQMRVIPLFLLCVAGVAVTKSAFALASLFYGLLWFAYCRGWRRSALVTGVMAAILGAFLFLDTDNPTSLFFHNGRLPIWIYAVNALGERPWLGYGVAEFSREFPAYHQVLGDKRWEEAHNELIEYVFNMGMVGLLVLLPFALSLGRRIYFLPRSKGKELAAGALLMLAVNAIGSFPLQIAPFATLTVFALAWIFSARAGDT